MKFKKTLFIFIIGIISLVVLYNYIVNPMLVQNNGYNSWVGNSNSMGMHGHMGETYNSNSTFNNTIDIKSLSVIVIVILGFIVAAFYIFRNQSNRCVKCGYEIKDDSWRICPVCGAQTRGNGRRKG